MVGLVPEISVFLSKRFPGYRPSFFYSPFEVCLEIADWLLGPVNHRVWYVPATSNHGAGFFTYSSYHELTGQALHCAVNILLNFYQELDDVDSLNQHIDNAIRLNRTIKSVLSNAFSNAVVQQATQLGLHIDFPVAFTSPVLVPQVVQIGIGSNSRILHETGTDRDSYIGVKLCRQKHKCNDLLTRLGYKVPRNILLQGQLSSDTLVRKASVIGYPCVVKPCDKDNGLGVSINVCDSTALVSAAVKAGACSSNGILIEEHVPGDYHRLYVIGGELVNIMRLRPPFLLGDGLKSIRDILNSPTCHEEKPGGLVAGAVISLDDPSVASCLAHQNFCAESVPKSGQIVVLRSDLVDRSDWSPTFFTSSIDLNLSKMACGIARAIGLDNVGIDVISPDITLPCSSREIWVIDVNPFQLLHPTWADVFIKQFSTSIQHSRIPIEVIVCTDNIFDSPEFVDSLATQSFDVWAIPKDFVNRSDFTDKITSDSRFYCYDHPREVLSNRDFRSIVFLIDWHELLEKGLPVMHIDKLQLFGTLDEKKLELWEKLLKQLGYYSLDQSFCDLPLQQEYWQSCRRKYRHQ